LFPLDRLRKRMKSRNWPSLINCHLLAHGGSAGVWCAHS
jgi:hypothetical protein